MNSSARSVLNALRQRSPIVLDVPADIRYRLLRRYLEMSLRSSRLTTLSFAIFLFGFAYEAPLWPRVVAVAAMAAVNGLRSGFARRLLERMDPAAPRSHPVHDAIVLATTMAWGLAPYLLQHRISDANLYGILYGALIPLTTIPIGYISALPGGMLAVACGAVPLVAFMLQQRSMEMAVMGVATVMCVSTLLARAVSSHRTLLQALVAERENALLVEELQRYRHALETENATLGSSLRDAAQAANRDALTGLFNRRHVDAFAQQLGELVRRGQEDVTLCMIDVDHFKKVNDAHGHPVGDEVLRVVGELLAARLRDGDCLARIGGEEFMAVLRNCDVNRGRRVAESLRHNVAASHIVTDAGEVPVTVSLGVAQWAADEALDDVVERADRALYEAKHSGRDRVEIDPGDASRLTTMPMDLMPPGRVH